MSTPAYEKLGQFYLGKRYDLETRTRHDDLVLVDAKDYTTHAVIIGMTGSGKTGLGIGMLEEAAIDHIPVIAIDPKGDLGNIALTFPNLAASDFRPWIDPQQATAAGLDPEGFADAQASLWRKGLDSWGQDGARIQRLRDAADVAIYTPGSSAGRPLSLLRGFSAPPPVVRQDAEAFAERVNATATGLLALLGLEADPITSREHILLANLFSHAWQQGQDLDLPALIGAVQQPPFAQIGVMPVDTVFPAKDRMGFAMRLNNLLAAPGFQAWMQGDPLDTASLLYTPTGKPRVSVVSIAHLGDAERMFFVTMLLADVIAWMRQQPGTGSLRAILYIDELFGYMPPVANPPSKLLLLTLLKQARAFGLGVIMATQNPVDLDYKGLSNTGLWFIGRLQTERDKARVMDGLAGASGGAPFDQAAMERTISGLGKRVFLMHSVHENEPTTFETRWAMSYLAGPMTREQIRRLGESTPSLAPPAATPVVAPLMAATPAPSSATTPSASTPVDARPPILPPEIVQVWFPSTAGADAVWRPAVLGVADIAYENAKLGVAEQERTAWLCALDEGVLALDWTSAQAIDVDVNRLERSAQAGSEFAAVPAVAATAKSYATWTRALQKFITTNGGVTLYQSKALKLVSHVGESEGAFRARLQLAAREAADAKIEAVRRKYAVRVNAATEKVRKAEAAIGVQEQKASQAKLDSALTIGSAVLGALFGRKKVSASTLGKAGTAARSMGRASARGDDVERARQSFEAAQQELADLEARITEELALESAAFDALAEQLDEVVVRPKSTGVQVQVVALAWVPDDNAPPPRA
ncbi:MAG: ATP-binding protein [Gemmatimonadaceae bacterium]|jgi:hypothetical protein|nr:ATP-binding protein [Gemmatimonadaceae bacterium]